MPTYRSPSAAAGHVAAFGLQPVLVRERPELGRGPPVVGPADLDLGVARVGEHLERPGEVELVVGEQVADREELDADLVERYVAATGAPPPVVVVATAARARHSGHRPERPERRGSAR